MSNACLAVEHLLLRLRPINRALWAAVARQAAKAAKLDRPDLVPLCITDGHVTELLREVDAFVQIQNDTALEESLALTAEEEGVEQRLRQRASGSRRPLPIDALGSRLNLGRHEVDALLICAAPELDRNYERIYAYILDDLNRRFPCVELLADLTAGSRDERLAQRRDFGPFGRLRRCGLLESFGDSTTGVRTQLRLGRGVLEFLLGSSSTAVDIWRDAAEIPTDAGSSLLRSQTDERIGRIGKALAAGTINVVGFWGRSESAPDAAARALARAAGKPLRRLTIATLPSQSNWPADAIRTALQMAAALDAILQIPVDSLHEVENRAVSDAVAQMVASCDVPILLTGAEPWRPTQVLSVRTYAELHLTDPNCQTRQQRWAEAIPEIDGDLARDLSSRFRMSPDEMEAVGRIARAQAWVEGNGKPAPIEDHLDAACATVAQKTRGRFLGAVKPRRGPDDLILPPALHRQVLEVASFTRILPQVSERWGFGRLATGGSGMKCLFTGDPGTGKTLAAEVIAGQLSTPLLKVNIAEIVSKWVGETEKNLDAAFQEAVSNHAVLFFDEADSLFGKRGEVQHGVDRYANLEVSHLLQRLEDHDGLVILASNLKENIDPAFTRRFHVVLHFPRPVEADRRRIWGIAFPPQAPLERQVDLFSLSRLDMTGAAIVGAARTAALLAANEGHQQIKMAHVIRGIARQFRREARVLSTADLGSYASLLQEQT